MKEVGSLREWRFVPIDWRDPFEYHRWYMVTDEKTIAHMRIELKDAAPVTWYYGQRGRYVAEVSYDAMLRPLLVVIGNFR